MYAPSMYASHSSRRSRQEQSVHGVFEARSHSSGHRQNPRERRKEGRTQTRSSVPPSLRTRRARMPGKSTDWRTGRLADAFAVSHSAALNRGGALCRPCHGRRGVGTARGHLGRERPHLPCPLLRPMAELDGVAHASPATDDAGRPPSFFLLAPTLVRGRQSRLARRKSDDACSRAWSDR
jgi:hypothetical protein